MKHTTKHIPLWQREDASPQELRKEYSREYDAWGNMRARARKGDYTYSKKFDDFPSFLRHLGPRPSDEHSLDRIDASDPEYGPGKVRWADKRTQSNNRRNTIFLTYDGDTNSEYKGQKKALTEWAELLDVSPQTLRRRKKDGWNDSEIIDGIRDLGDKPFHKMSKSELINFQPWDEETPEKDEKEYLSKRKKNEDRWEFYKRYYLRGRWIALRRKAKELAIFLPDLEWEEAGSAKVEAELNADRVVGDWLLHEDVSPEDRWYFKNDLDEFEEYRGQVMAEYDEWKRALVRILQKEKQTRVAKEIEAKFKQ